ncbi:unnamed protein product [Clavelina lepadiformis]|uniref:Uncharacterized protein n=1 Tax=Clavelina lepadiformis TaxID=159417 RepID=A0ABP0G9Q1_CLALP
MSCPQIFDCHRMTSAKPCNQLHSENGSHREVVSFKKTKIKYGQECTVSLNDLSPCPREAPNSNEIPVTGDIIRNSLPNNEVANNAPVVDEPELQNMPIERNLRLSSRTNKGVPPARYGEQ